MAIDVNGKNVEDLVDVLELFGINPLEWKSGKTAADLLEEVREGESQLVLARLVEVVKMRVLSTGRPRMELVELGKRRKNGDVVMHDKPLLYSAG